MSSNRIWTTVEWKKLFVENPIMHTFAIGLIWGDYDSGGKLKTSFRYMEDGTFTSVNEDGITLDGNTAIGLCHPLDLGEDIIAQWTRQLSDYEIRRPVEQLARKIFRVTEDHKSVNSVSDFGGAVVYAVSLLSKLQKFGWRKGLVWFGLVWFGTAAAIIIFTRKIQSRTLTRG